MGTNQKKQDGDRTVKNRNDQMAKIAELDKRYEAVKAERIELEARQEKLKEKIGELESKRLACAESGRTDEYRALMDELRKTEDELFVADKRLEKLRRAPIEKDEILDAWKQYDECFSEEISAQIRQYAKLKEELLAVYGEMLDAQEKALSVRKHLYEFLGADDRDQTINEMLPIRKTIPCRTERDSNHAGLVLLPGIRIQDPDFVFYASDCAAQIGYNGSSFLPDNPLLRAVMIIEHK